MDSQWKSAQLDLPIVYENFSSHFVTGQAPDEGPRQFFQKDLDAGTWECCPAAFSVSGENGFLPAGNA